MRNLTSPLESGPRLFFAVAPDPATRASIAEVAAELRLGGGSRITARDDYHMTLAFIGEVPPDRFNVLRAIGQAQCANIFTLRFDAYEYWPKPEVIVAAARVIPDEIQGLWQGLHLALGEHRWALEPKRLRPHVTLARKVAQPPVLQAMSPFDWPVREFSLMRSERGGAGSAYTVVDTWPLLYDSVKT